MSDMTKVGQRRERTYPVSQGLRSLPELAALFQEGLGWQEAARLWGMRPRAGAADLRWDVTRLWDQAGRPGCPKKPAGHRPRAGYHPEWDAYSKEIRLAVERWVLSKIGDGVPLHHCATCTCRAPIGEVDG